MKPTSPESLKRTVREPRGATPSKNEGAPAAPRWVRPTNFVEDLAELPEKAVAFDKAGGLRKLRALRHPDEAAS